MMEKCRHCGKKDNTHQLLTLTCRSCGRPRSYDVDPLGTLIGPYDFYDNFISPMCCYSNAVKIGGKPLMLGDQVVYSDSEHVLYTIGSTKA